VDIARVPVAMVWSTAEDRRLRYAVSMYGTSWVKVSELIGDVSACAARNRWLRIGDEVFGPPDYIETPIPLDALYAIRNTHPPQRA